MNGEAILKRLASMPLHTWHYRREAEDVRHIGPTAQDFAAAFGLGDGDRAIATVDADGVALAAIQALYRALLERDQESRDLRAEIELLRRRVDSLTEKTPAP